jgi:hypothetical protein
MKIDAISIIERAFIIRVLREQGKWEANRMGAHVRIYRFRTADRRGRIEYAVGRGTFNRYGNACTVGQAVVEINQIIAGRADRSVAAVPVPMLATAASLPFAERS